MKKALNVNGESREKDFRPYSQVPPRLRHEPFTSLPPEVPPPPGNSPKPTGSESPMLYMWKSLFDHGNDQAIASGALDPDQLHLKVIQEHAKAIARETRRDLYDPKVKYQDALREAEYRKHMTDRDYAEIALKHSAADVREKEVTFGKVSSFGRPGVGAWITSALIVGISITIAPTLHDFLFISVSDSVFAWLFSLASSGFLAGSIVWAILGSSDTSGRRTNWWGLIAGIVVSLGLGLLRWSGAVEQQEKLLALALTIVEVGLVIFAERVSMTLKAAQNLYNEAAGAHEAANAEHQRRQQAVLELNKKITDHIDYVEDRDLRNVNLNELIETAIKAVTDGYYAGIATNRGGVIRSGSPR